MNENEKKVRKDIIDGYRHNITEIENKIKTLTNALEDPTYSNAEVKEAIQNAINGYKSTIENLNQDIANIEKGNIFTQPSPANNPNPGLSEEDQRRLDELEAERAKLQKDNEDLTNGMAEAPATTIPVRRSKIDKNKARIVDIDKEIAEIRSKGQRTNNENNSRSNGRQINLQPLYDQINNLMSPSLTEDQQASFKAFMDVLPTKINLEALLEIISPFIMSQLNDQQKGLYNAFRSSLAEPVTHEVEHESVNHIVDNKKLRKVMTKINRIDTAIVQLQTEQPIAKPWRLKHLINHINRLNKKRGKIENRQTQITSKIVKEGLKKYQKELQKPDDVLRHIEDHNKRVEKIDDLNRKKQFYDNNASLETNIYNIGHQINSRFRSLLTQPRLWALKRKNGRMDDISRQRIVAAGVSRGLLNIIKARAQNSRSASQTHRRK